METLLEHLFSTSHSAMCLTCFVSFNSTSNSHWQLPSSRPSCFWLFAVFSFCLSRLGDNHLSLHSLSNARGFLDLPSFFHIHPVKSIDDYLPFLCKVSKHSWKISHYWAVLCQVRPNFNSAVNTGDQPYSTLILPFSSKTSPLYISSLSVDHSPFDIKNKQKTLFWNYLLNFDHQIYTPVLTVFNFATVKKLSLFHLKPVLSLGLWLPSILA